MQELEDQRWFPQRLRAYQMEYIGWLVVRMDAYRALVAHWRDHGPIGAVRVDLCSGSGEPAMSVHYAASPFQRLTLTDRYPPRGIRTPPGIRYAPGPVDVRLLQPEQGVVYTMFNAFHHFTAQEQQRLVGRMRRAGASAWFVEPLEPTVTCLLQVLAATTVGVLLLMPFVRPFSWGRLFFTYLLPLNLITIPWDGVVSVLRSRSASTYRTRLAPLGALVQRLPGTPPLTVIHLPGT